MIFSARKLFYACSVGHISQKSLQKLLSRGMILGELSSTGDKIVCDACIQAKIARKPLPQEPRDRTSRFGDRVYSDVWGPSRHLTIDKKSYYISFIDDYSRESVIYLMANKSEAFSKYKLYEALMLRQRDAHIKVLVSDRGGEYTSSEFKQHLAKQGTKHRFTVHDTPESNGVAERLNRTLLEKTRAMLLESGLPKTLWGYAILHANYLRNRTHTRALPDKTPYEMTLQEKPNLKDVHTWGIEVYVKVNQGDKLAARAKRAWWIGISDQSHGHYIYWPDSQKVSVERNIVFDSEIKKGKVPIISIEESKLPTSNGVKQAIPAPVPAPNRLVSEGAKIE
jgi:transposase InsO family protein